MQRYSWLKLDGSDTLVIIKVKTRQTSDQFIIEDEYLVIKITEAPIKGKANKKLVKMLKKMIKTEIVLESGQTSSIKVFRIKYMTPTQVISQLQNTKN